jgi:hypothetical protein
MTEVDDTIMHNIANFMVVHGSQKSTMHAGLTYIGQMVSHDIVPPSSPKVGGRLVTPVLNLDSVYGITAPPSAFAVRKVVDSEYGVTGYDMNRVQNRAMVPEHRNDENVIVSQLHVFWQRLHNYLVEELSLHPEKAKEYTIKTFQLIVIEEFIKRILQPTIYKAYFEHNQRFLPNRQSNSIPTFFSHAAFRFGHSMVRNAYAMRTDDDSDVSLSNLFNGGKPLTPKLAIDWTLFFGANSQCALRIDMGITDKMRKVNFPIDSHSLIDVLYRNLKAGEFTSLPGGHEFCNYLNWYNVKNEDFSEFKGLKLNHYNERLSALNDIVPINQLPLWPYLLVEAEITSELGENLGVLGSILVADVLKQSIQQSTPSVISPDGYDYKSAVDSMGSWGTKIKEIQGVEKLKMEQLISTIN